tara:strand:- start:10 stop:927 length:918 start_codon:yes stop_codon:yes gene_type:complete
MNILITGVAGFIGSHIARRFIDEGFNVIGIDNLSSGKEENIPKEVNFFNIDLIDYSSLSIIPSNCDLILHLAGQSSGEISFHNPIEDLSKNTISTLNLIKFGIKNKTKRFVYASSMSVYGDVNCSNKGVSEKFSCEPKSCYGIGKLASEQYLNVYKNQLPFVSLRMFNVYGPGQDMDNMKQGMVSIYLSQAIKKRSILVKGSLSRFRDFIFIDDVVEVWFRASFNKNVINQAINLGTGIKTNVSEILEIIKDITKIDKISLEEGTPCDQLGIYSDNTKLANILDFKPKIKLVDGLNIFYEWSREI